ncbi:hypothetical protein [Streptomyces sp. NPDC054975]
MFDTALTQLTEGFLTQLPASLLTALITALTVWGFRKWREREK